MKELRLGFVGAGYMGQLAHLANYATLRDCRIVALAEPRERLAQKIAGRYEIKEVYADHRELLERSSVDAIVASQPFDRHIKLLPDILRKGIPIFTEKPLAVSLEAGMELVRLAENNKVLHMVGYHKRSDLAVEFAKKLILDWTQSGEYGKMRLVRITMPPCDDWYVHADNRLITTEEPYPSVEREGLPSCYDQKQGEEYKSFINYYIHQINALRFLFGQPFDIVHTDKAQSIIVVESDGGVCGTIEMAPYVTANSWQESFFVSFERAFIRIDLPSPLISDLAGRLFVMKKDRNGDETVTEHSLPNYSAMYNQARNFLAAVRGERSAPCDSREALEDLKIANRYMDSYIHSGR